MDDWTGWVRDRLDLGELTPERQESIVREIARMLEDAHREERAGGASEAEARERARARLGDVDTLRRELLACQRGHRREAAVRWRDRWLDRHAAGDGPRRPRRRAALDRIGLLGADLLDAVRRLGRSPGFAAVVVLTLALGIGATTAVFSVAHTVLFRDLPYPDAGRLGLVRVDALGRSGLPVITDSNLIDFREQAETVEALATVRTFDATLEHDGVSQGVTAARVDPELLDLLSVRPIRGRPFQAGTDTPPEGFGAVLLSAELWRSRFGEDDEILARTVEVDDREVPVVGVVGEDQRLLIHPGVDERVDLWIAREPVSERGTIFRNVAVVRLRPGASFEEASAELDGIDERTRVLDRSDPDEVPATYRVAAPHRQALGALLAAVGFVLLLVSANVANLLLARARGRERDWSVRAVLGAGRLRLLLQALAEVAVLAGAGGLLGLGVARLALGLLVRFQPVDLPRMEEMGLDPAVLGFALGATLLTSLLAGLVPAWRCSGAGLGERLRLAGRGRIGGRGRLTRFLVGAEVALAVVLLVGAGLMLRTLVNLQRVPLGFEPDRLLTVLVPVDRELGEDGDARLRFDRRLVEEVEALPGVVSASLTNLLPLAGGSNLATFAHDEESAERFGDQTASFQRVFPGYFETLGIELLAGRDFAPADSDLERDVVIVGRELAATAWPGEDPLRRRLLIDFATAEGGTEQRWADVVGVVETVRRRDLHSDQHPQVYLPYWSRTFGQRLAVRTAGDPAAAVPGIREVVDRLGSGRPLREIHPMTDHVAAATRGPRFLLLLVAVFAGLSVVLACLGVYAVLANAVSRRSREIGVRIALGARRREVFRMVMSQGLTVTAAGAATGVAGAVGLGRLVRGLLYGVAPHDPATVAGVVAMLFAVAALACALPARRATRVDPVEVIQGD